MSHELIGRVIDARPGQKLQLKVREHNGSDRERKVGVAASESGSITFAVADQRNTADLKLEEAPTEETERKKAAEK